MWKSQNDELTQYTVENAFVVPQKQNNGHQKKEHAF